MQPSRTMPRSFFDSVFLIKMSVERVYSTDAWGDFAMTAISGVEFLIGLLIAASAIALLTKYLRIPYTVAWVLGGLLLSLLRP